MTTKSKLISLVLCLLVVVSIIPGVLAGKTTETDVINSIETNTGKVQAPEQVKPVKSLSPQTKERLVLAREKINNMSREEKRRVLKALILRNPRVTKMLQNLNLTKEQQHKINLLTRSELRKLGPKNISAVLKKYKVIRVKKEEAFRARKIEAAKFRLYNKKIQQARNRYLIAKNNFNKLSKKIKQKCNLSADECEQIRVETGKQLLYNLTDMMLASLNKSRCQILSSDKINDSVAESIVNDIDKVMDKIKSYQEQISDVQTIEDLKNLNHKIIAAWKKTRYSVYYNFGRYEVHRVGLIIKKAEYLEVKLDRVLSRAEEQGINVSIVSDLVDKFDSQISNARKHYDKARELIAEFKANKNDMNSEDKKTLVKNIHDEIKAAQDSLKEAGQTLREIVININRKKIRLEDNTDNTIEILEPVSTSEGDQE